MEVVKASNVLEWGDAFFGIDASSRTVENPIAWTLEGTLVPGEQCIESFPWSKALQSVVCSCDSIASWPSTRVVSYACVTGPGAEFVDVAVWPQAKPPITGTSTDYLGWNGSEFTEGPALADGSGNYWYRLEIDWSPPVAQVPGRPTFFAKTYRYKGEGHAAPFRIYLFRGAPEPQSVVENHRAYDFGAGAFTVAAVVGGPNAPTGPIASQLSRHGEVPLGWELAIVKDPDKQPPGRYLSFAVHGPTAVGDPKTATSHRFLAALGADEAPQIRDATSPVFRLPERVFDRLTHDVAVVRETTGACRMYLDGNLLDQVPVVPAPGPVDVTNLHRIEAGTVSPHRGPAEGFLVRRLGLWKDALTWAEICDQMNALNDPASDPACVGYWDFLHRDDKKDVDQSATKNDVVPRYRGRAVETQMVLPFYMQEQVQDNWCWSATSVSLAEFYDPPSNHRQCALVGDMFTDDRLNALEQEGFDVAHIANRIAPDKPACGNGDCYDYWFYLPPPLRSLGIFDQWSDDPGIESFLTSIRQRRPLLARVEWTGGNGHFIGIAGFYTKKVGDVEEQMVVIVDPFSDVTETTFAQFMAAHGYLGDGTWTANFHTSAAAATRPVGSP